MRIAYAKHAGKAPLIGSPVRASGLRLGSAGYRVEALQKRLNEIGFPVKVDSDFGTGTRRAVLAFQAENGLEVDGVVGPATQAALDTAEAKIPETRQNATMADLRAEGSTIVKGRTVRRSSQESQLPVLRRARRTRPDYSMTLNDCRKQCAPYPLR
ncbi:peptidoglycan-binding protein [Ochrobactrum tritici]|uniref:Peptidoglycan-binding protein n=1 Tax=Brucella tritici TaxID=94626 RepID=A0A7X6J9Y5_9HYPH|nr:peptidoglycan-binding protein [Brucella tritici]